MTSDSMRLLKLANKIVPTRSLPALADYNMMVEGMLYRMRIGCPWRDLPKAFGCWNSIYKRFNA